MNTALQLLIEADKTLERISVKGDDVFAMANVRSLLKAAYDAMRKEEKAHVSAESVSDLDGPGSSGD